MKQITYEAISSPHELLATYYWNGTGFTKTPKSFSEQNISSQLTAAIAFLDANGKRHIHEWASYNFGITDAPNCVTLAKINKAIAARYPAILLCKEADHFYIWSADVNIGLKLAMLYSTCIYVHPNTMQDIPIEKWLSYVEYLLTDQRRMPNERVPVI